MLLLTIGGNRLSPDIVIPAKAGIQESLHPIPWIGLGLSGFRLKAGMTIWAENDSSNLS